jgi:integrase
MQLANHQSHDGKKVWLTEDEVETLLSSAKDEKQRLAFGLMVRSGLRVQEAVDVTRGDLVRVEGGYRIRVQHGKGDKYRETPVSESLYWLGRGVVTEDSDRLIGREKRTLQKWVYDAADRLYEETGDIGYSYLSPHDLRRTWGTLLIQHKVEPMLVMSWGGWESLKTFQEAYMNVHSPAFQAEELEKVSWL